MKIILSPAKTMQLTQNEHCQTEPLAYRNKTNELQNELLQLSREALGKRLHIKNKLLTKTYELLHQENKPKGHAFYSYNGLVFQQLSTETYEEAEYNYITSHIRILDALYGVLHPCNLISHYRLDMKYKRSISLYDFWDVTPYFNKEELIINLASNEFSKMLHTDMITIVFKEHRNNTYKTIATYAKQARGMMLDYMITNKITTIKKIKLFSCDNYQFNTSLSTSSTLVFTR